MADIALRRETIPAIGDEALARLMDFEGRVLQAPQVPVCTDHVLHAGQYTRTLFMPQGMVITGALVKIPTTLIVQGDVLVSIGDEARRLKGYAVLAAAAHRKQAFVALEDTHLTMTFPTQAKTVEEAEREFTDDADRLASRLPEAINTFTITSD